MIDDRSMFVEVAKSIGLHGFQYDGLASIKEKISSLDFKFK
jgi:hypothetical protein